MRPSCGQSEGGEIPCGLQVALLLGCLLGLAMSTNTYAEFPERWSPDSLYGGSNTVLRWLLQRVKKLEAQVAVLQGEVTALEEGVTALDDRITAHEAAQLAVFDATNTKVGDVLGITLPDVFIALRVDTHAFALPLTTERFMGTVEGIGGGTGGELGVAFASTDCSGTPFVLDNRQSSVLPITQVAGPGSTVYIQEPGVASQLPTLRSILTVRGVCELAFHDTTRVFPARAVVNLHTLFRPPFVVR